MVVICLENNCGDDGYKLGFHVSYSENNLAIFAAYFILPYQVLKYTHYVAYKPIM